MDQAPSVPRTEFVSVVIVADADAAVTRECLESLRGVTVLDARLEAVVVAAPGSAFASSAAEDDFDLRIVELKETCGLAEARNAGARAARGAQVAFLSVDARPDRDWLDAATSVFRGDSRVAAVASRVVSPDGQTEFAGAALTFAGEPVSLHRGSPADEFDDAADGVLFAAEAAMIVDAKAFRWVGGFDEELTADVEFADLGWRLWLHGFHVAYVPRSLVVGYAWSQGGPESGVTRRLLGSLGMIYKNYDDRHLGNAMAAAVVGANRTPEGAAAVAGLVERLPRLVEARRKIQADRVVGDDEILPLFRSSLAIPEHGDHLAAIRDAFITDGTFACQRIAIVTPDVLRPQMAGPGIRSWQMACALAREHDVQLATTVQCDLSHPDFPVRHVTDGELRELESWCDVFIFQGDILAKHPWLLRSKKVLVVDIYDPIHLEVLEHTRDLDEAARRHTVRITTEVINRQLAHGDYFLCASEKQRDFWIGQLAGVGRVNQAVYDGSQNLQSLITVVPFGVSDEEPRHTRPVLKGVVPGIDVDDKVVLWGGGVYNWFDPLTLIRAVHRLRDRVPEVRLYFMGMRHPNPAIPAMRMAFAAQRLAEELGLVNKNVFFNEGWVDYDDRQNYLLEADVGVSTHLDQVETAFSFRTRILDYVWAALPVVATTGDSFAELIQVHGLGLTVPPADDAALEEALYELLTDEHRNASCRTAIRALVDQFRWRRALQPLLRFCRAPRRAADLVDPRQRAMIGDPMAQAVWGQAGWRVAAAGLLDHLRHREYDEVVRKVRMRARAFLFPEAAGPGVEPRTR